MIPAERQAPQDRDGLSEAYRRILRPPWDDRLELDTLDKQVRACVLLAQAYSDQRKVPVVSIRATGERAS
jgi:hypothetical protein